MPKDNPPPQQQRALVLQGGGALGGYEAGAFKALHEKFFNPAGEGQFFDIVAGVSIGAVNASVLVANVLNNGNKWTYSADAIYRFWDEISTPNNASSLATKSLMWLLDSDIFKKSWDYGQFARHGWNIYWNTLIQFMERSAGKTGGDEQNPQLDYFLRPNRWGSLASGEAARRYYAWRYFLSSGAPNVISPGLIQFDTKFLDLLNPFSTLVRFDNTPIAQKIQEFWNPLASIVTDDGQPRLLIASIDIENCATATFDSYPKKDEMGKPTRQTIYGEEKTKYSISYPDGITMEHLMTSMSSHLRYEYPTLLVKNESTGELAPRHFWDGVYLSNTPLRELLQAHRDYWHKVRGLTDNIPKLVVYIVDLYPTKERGLPQAPDEIIDRQYDVLFHDKTAYDEKVAHMVTDYVDLTKRMNDLARKAINEVKENSKREKMNAELNAILTTKAKSLSRDGKDRFYGSDLMEGRFEVEVFRIERLEDLDDTDISGKAFDFSASSIRQLRAEGEKHVSDLIRDGKLVWES